MPCEIPIRPLDVGGLSVSRHLIILYIQLSGELTNYAEGWWLYTEERKGYDLTLELLGIIRQAHCFLKGVCACTLHLPTYYLPQGWCQSAVSPGRLMPWSFLKCKEWENGLSWWSDKAANITPRFDRSLLLSSSSRSWEEGVGIKLLF